MSVFLDVFHLFCFSYKFLEGTNRINGVLIDCRKLENQTRLSFMLLLHDLWKKGGFRLLSPSNNIDQLTCRQVVVFLYELSKVAFKSIDDSLRPMERRMLHTKGSSRGQRISFRVNASGILL